MSFQIIFICFPMVSVFLNQFHRWSKTLSQCCTNTNEYMRPHRKLVQNIRNRKETRLNIMSFHSVFICYTVVSVDLNRFSLWTKTIGQCYKNTNEHMRPPSKHVQNHRSSWETGSIVMSFQSIFI